MNKVRFPLACWLAATAMFALPAVALAQTIDKPKKTAAKPAPKRNATAPAPTTQATLGGAQPTVLGLYGEWGAYAAVAGDTKVCFALAKPQDSRTVPPGRPRDATYLFIATRPAENVKNEVSVAIGYSFKPGVEASVEIGVAKFAMYTQSDGAWVKNAAEEPRMVDVMRKGADMVVTGTSTKGTKSTDRYSLKGLSQALDRAAQECR